MNGLIADCVDKKGNSTVKPKPEFLESYAPKPEQDKLTGGYVLPLSPDTLERARI